jgi:tetratricopeptide (TPR) repeat protein
MIKRHFRPKGLTLVLCLLVAGCAHNRYATQIDATRPLELTDTPFFPQEDYQCGPAALATVLSASGLAVSPDELRAQVYLPGRRGSLQIELLAASRRHGRLPYVLDPEWPSIQRELQAGRSVLVLQNLGLSWSPVWHYAVVVGYDPVHQDVILRSGTEARQIINIDRFMRSWARASYWAMVVLAPGQEPVRIDKDRYLHAVAALEASGQPTAAEQFYQAALVHWPGDPLALFGLANIALAQKRWAAAEVRYRELLSIEPDHVAARNNLAYLLMKRGCRSAALAEIQTAMTASGVDDPLKGILEETYRDILSEAFGPVSSGCPGL